MNKDAEVSASPSHGESSDEPTAAATVNAVRHQSRSRTSPPLGREQSRRGASFRVQRVFGLTRSCQVSAKYAEIKTTTPSWRTTNGGVFVKAKF